MASIACADEIADAILASSAIDFLNGEVVSDRPKIEALVDSPDFIIGFATKQNLLAKALENKKWKAAEFLLKSNTGSLLWERQLI